VSACEFHNVLVGKSKKAPDTKQSFACIKINWFQGVYWIRDTVTLDLIMLQNSVADNKLEVQSVKGVACKAETPWLMD